MENFRDSIDRQIKFNKGKNLFHRRIMGSLRFSPETVDAIQKIGKIDIVLENILIDDLTNRVLQEFCTMNQYYSFSESSKSALKDIYIDLFHNIKNSKTSIDEIATDHYRNLIRWLQMADPCAELIYTSKNKYIEPAACSEYSAAIQLEILQLNMWQIKEPVLDIGCGKEANLVTHLRQNGIEAYGIDRFVADNSFLTNSDWFEYEFGNKRWGTIISNLGFSNHFIHHHLRNDGSFVAYAKQLMRILDSLKTGGSFYYAPDLPFVEQYLDENSFQVTRQKINNYELNSVRIKRMN